MGKRKKTTRSKRGSKQKKQSKWPAMVAILGIVIVLAIGGWLVFRPKPVPTEAAVTDAAPTEAAPPFPIGHAATCMRRPKFIAEMGFTTDQPLMATALAGVMGFAMADPNTGQIAQHPTWDDAGFLGGSVRDSQGNIYIYPAPYGSTENNPPAEQNKLYMIDTNSGEMAEWIDLPSLAAPTETVNPYGITGIFLDCDTQSLYVASVMGSVAGEEFGRIFQVDLATKQILDTYDNIDALGVGVFNGIHGKRLYFGLARNSAILSIALDTDGHFEGEPRREFFLAELEGGGNEKGQRISFPLIGVEQSGNMVIKGIEFDFTLRAAGTANIAKYEFSYQPDDDNWQLVGIKRETQ